MNSWHIPAICVILIAGLVLAAGCTGSGYKTVTTASKSVTPQPLPAVAHPVTSETTPVMTSQAVPAATAAQTPTDPILGQWDNGMVFNADGTVELPVPGSGTTSWKLNSDENNSYFIITENNPVRTDANGAMFLSSRQLTTTEWLYDPVHDTIHRKGAPEFSSRNTSSPEEAGSGSSASVIGEAQITSEKQGLTSDGNLFVSGVVRNNMARSLTVWVGVDCFSAGSQKIGTAQDGVKINSLGNSSFRIVAPGTSAKAKGSTCKAYIDSVYESSASDRSAG
jgi:hypothetical protein